MIRLGAICSSGGSVLGTAYELLKRCGYDVQFAVVTDRACSAELLCENLGIEWTRIDEPDNREFSTLAADWLYELKHAQFSCLFFARLVSSEFFIRAPCVNFHPSLLPMFPGFGALKKTLESGVRFIGATAHVVDESIDGGPILAQVTAPLPPHVSMVDLERISFAQKLYLLLLICENAERGELDALLESQRSSFNKPARPWASPAIKDLSLASTFEQFLMSEGIPWQL